jgi:hypothetical protein
MITEMQKLRCFFEFPYFIIGYPLYDLNKCIEYVKTSLTSNGFLVNYYFPNYIYISWDFNEMNKPEQKASTKLTKDTYLTSKKIYSISNKTDYKPLLSSTIQKQNGKIVLNL